MVRTLAACLCLILAGGCAQLAAPPEKGFELAGRVAVRYEGKAGTESATGRVQWRHSDAADDLLVTNPLGQGVARILRGADGVRLETSDGRTYRAPDAEALTQEVLGWRLPLNGLADWMRGRPRPGSSADVQPGEDGRPFSIRQDGWNVEYEEYAGNRPARMRLTHPNVEIRLVVESMNDALADGP
jgi:outer membrane lipoprotein LolB